MEYIAYSLAYLLAAAALKTLIFAFRETRDGGIGRLGIKYPRLLKRSRIYERRWGLMTATLSLLALTAQMGSLAMPFLAWKHALLGSAELVWILPGLLLLHFLLLDLVSEIVGQTYSDRLSALALPFASLLCLPFGFILLPLRAGGNWLDRNLHSRSHDRPTASPPYGCPVGHTDHAAGVAQAHLLCT